MRSDRTSDGHIRYVKNYDAHKEKAMDQQPMREPRPDRHHGQAIASMVLGILSLVLVWLPYLGCILALVAVALSAACINGGTAGAVRPAAWPLPAW